MAVRKRKDAWQVYWKNPYTGRQEAKTFSTKAEAEKENSLILHRLKYERESFAPPEEEDTTQSRTLDQVYLKYLQEKQFARSHLVTHRSRMKIALEMYGQTPIEDLTVQDLEKLKVAYVANAIPATAHTQLTTLRTVINFAVRKGYTNPLPFPQIPSPHYKEIMPPTPEEIEAMLTAAPPHIQRVIIIGAYLGVLVGPCELLQLTWEDVDLDRLILRIHGSKKNPSAPWREVPIRESLLSIFKVWRTEDLDACMYYLIHYRGKPITDLKNAWRAMLKRACITRRIRPYDLRHAFDTELVAAGVDVGTVAKLMGHKQKRAAVEALPVVSMASWYGKDNNVTK